MTGSRKRSIRSLMLMRTMIWTNSTLLVCIGILYLAFGSKPTGYVVAGVLGVLAVALWGLLPFTDPYRAERHNSRW